MAKILKNNNLVEKPRINQELRFYTEVRLVYKEKANEQSENDFTKVVSINDAFKLSREYELDLVEINSKVTPPIIRLCDYTKYLFDLKKAAKHKNKNVCVCKEIQLKTNISLHDLEIKVNKAKEFLNSGNKVKVVLTMKGRELGRRELSKDCFNKFIELTSDIAVFDSAPKDEGNKVICILKKR